MHWSLHPAKINGMTLACAGVPVHVVLQKCIRPGVLKESLSGLNVAGLTLHDDPMTPPPSFEDEDTMLAPACSWSQLAPALAGLAPTLTALRGLPYWEVISRRMAIGPLTDRTHGLGGGWPPLIDQSRV